MQGNAQHPKGPDKVLIRVQDRAEGQHSVVSINDMLSCGATHKWISRSGLPAPTFEHRVVVNGHVYYLDLAWPALLVAVECNDSGSHDTPKAFQRDPMKRNRCQGAGWIYLEFTWEDLVHRTEEVLAQVTAALERAVAA